MPPKTERRPPARAAALLILVLSLVLAAATLFTSAPAARAQEKAAPVAAAAGADVKEILPYLDDGTVLVIRLDVDRVDPAVLGKFMTKMGDTVPKRIGMPADQQGRMRQEMIDGIDVSTKWLAGMTEAGARHVYVSFMNTADQQQGGDEPLTIVPLAAGAEAGRITDLMKVDAFNGRRAQSAQIGDAIVQGRSEQLDRIRAYFDAGGGGAKAPGVNAADLAAALAAAGDAPLRFVLVPGERARTWLEEALPMLPEFFGGGDGKLLTRDLRWAAAGFAQRPDVIANFTLKAGDPAKAKALIGVLGKALAFAREQVAATPGGEENIKQIDAVKPKLTGDTVTFAADPIELQIALMGMEDRGRQAPPAAPGAAPAKPDDGGL